MTEEQETTYSWNRNGRTMLTRTFHLITQSFEKIRLMIPSMLLRKAPQKQTQSKRGRKVSWNYASLKRKETALQVNCHLMTGTLAGVTQPTQWLLSHLNVLKNNTLLSRKKERLMKFSVPIQCPVKCQIPSVAITMNT